MRRIGFEQLILSLVSGVLILGWGLAACDRSSTSTLEVTINPIPIFPTEAIASPTITPYPALALTPTPAWPDNLIGFLGEHASPWDLLNLLSPDGQWVVRDPILLGNPPIMRIVSTSAPTVTLYGNPDGEVGVNSGPLVLSWSPDSSAVVVAGASEPAPCGYDRVIIYQITSQGDVIHNIYHLPDGEYGCIEVAWSPDSSQLALYYAREKVIILDRQGQFFRRLNIPDLMQIFWAEQGIFVEARQQQENMTHTELRLYDLAFSSQYQVLLERDEWYKVMGFNAEITQVLVASLPEPPTDQVPTYQLVVYDLTTGASQVVATMQGSIEFDRISQAPPTQIAFELDPQNEETSRLMIFDWGNGEVADYGECESLIGWRSNINGVLVIQRNMDNYWIEVVSLSQ
jgi:hypothetical protein